VLVDDASDDGTAAVAKQAGGVALAVINSQRLPDGWSGKLWALEQGAREVKTAWTLLLDADILLAPGMVATLLDKAKRENRQLVSIMASLRMESFWEKLLMPAFIYFFKLLYPFRLANSDSPYVAAAAGGCILLETKVIAQIGGFSAIRGAIIDDCNLAKQVKKRGNRIWIGQSHAVASVRCYDRLEPIWEMVARSAFTQLGYSVGLLILCTLLIASLFVAPVSGIVWGGDHSLVWSVVAYAVMIICYWPTLRYYRRNGAWALLLPVIACLYLAMTWTSAFRFWQGVRSLWKNRVYSVKE
jgi:hopene-associated glycosyltransferase HpnB